MRRWSRPISRAAKRTARATRRPFRGEHSGQLHPSQRKGSVRPSDRRRYSRPRQPAVPWTSRARRSSPVSCLGGPTIEGPRSRPLQARLNCSRPRSSETRPAAWTPGGPASREDRSAGVGFHESGVGVFVRGRGLARSRGRPQGGGARGLRSIDHVHKPPPREGQNPGVALERFRAPARQLPFPGPVRRRR